MTPQTGIEMTDEDMNTEMDARAQAQYNAAMTSCNRTVDVSYM